MYAVLQTHCAAEQMELVRLGSAVLWRMHHSRSPPTALLHAQARARARVRVRARARAYWLGLGLGLASATAAHRSAWCCTHRWALCGVRVRVRVNPNPNPRP